MFNDFDMQIQSDELAAIFGFEDNFDNFDYED